MLAWASVQMHCFCTVSDTKVANIEGDVSRKTSSTSLSSSSHTTSFQPTQGDSILVYSRTPTELFITHEILKHESKHVRRVDFKSLVLFLPPLPQIDD